MNYQNPYLNPYGTFGQYQPSIPVQMQQPQQVVRVNGRNGAMAYQIGANSSAMLLDESGLMVWLCTTDGAGYKTVQAYDIKPHEDAPVPDWNNLESRIARLEETINANTGDIAAIKRKTTKPDSAD